MIQITIEDGFWALADIYLQCVRDWARTPYAEALLRRLMNDDRHPSRKITAIGLLAITGKLTKEDRIALERQFNEALGDTAKSCLDGVDLVNGTVTTLPQAIFRFLISESSNDVEPG